MRYSFIIPIYNAEQYIDRCLKSIIEQYNNQFEILLINDGSIDDSKKICKAYENKYSFISLIDKKNEGPFAARLDGIKNAKGNYLLFVDSDDYVSEKMVNCLDHIIEKSKPDIIIFDVYKDNDGVITNHKSNLFDSTDSFIKKEEVCKKLITKEMTNGLWSKCIKRDLVKINPEFNSFKNVKMGEDLIQFIPFITNAKNIYYTNEKLYYYWMNNGGLTKKYNPNYYYSLKVVNNEIDKFIDNLGLSNYKELADTRFVKDIIDIIKLIATCDKKYKKNHEIKIILNDRYFIEKINNININSISFKNQYERLLCCFLIKRNIFIINIFMCIYKIKSMVK